MAAQRQPVAPEVRDLLRNEADERVTTALLPFLTEIAVAPEHRAIVLDGAQDAVNRFLAAWPDLPETV